MTDEMFQKAIETADSNGFYRERVNFLEGFLYALIENAENDYSNKEMRIDNSIFTTILRMFDIEAVDDHIKKLKEVKENDG